ncbi:MAG: Putative transmembrane protein [Candidatus Tokpelaia hoelldobleri]|uniref:Transmembrane protein n=1 Tax=Candidatus Tokpelaia hoelldobleri TaxID=1902579 RepID=A0A1U9JWH8_9HYPH|nr:MAG: Putative transmembrane protein [Candidatus Tokpelaia hoelldoblerii]
MKQQKPNPPRTYKRIRAATWCIMVVERLWPLCLPLLLLASLFATFAWFNIFSLLPAGLHGALLVLFALAAGAAALLLLRFSPPRRADVDRQIEKANTLAFQPLAAQDDEPAASASPLTRRLWQEHQHRMAQNLHHLRVGAPHPDIPRRDVHGLRFIVFLLCAVGFAFSFGVNGGRLGDAFSFSTPFDASRLRMDAWVTPPAYTGKPPVYLTRQGDGESALISVPQGSLVTIRLTGSNRRARLYRNPGTSWFATPIMPDKPRTDDNEVYTIPLQKSALLRLVTPGYTKNWQFQVTPDLPPAITWKQAPQRALNGTLELDYIIEDDFGALKGRVEITPAGQDEGANHPALYAVPQINLVMPRGGKGEARTIQDLTSHPWAGSDVLMWLVIEDGNGAQAKSEMVELTLPGRSFGNPLARALVEQRRLLAQDVMQRNHVLDMLSALMARPEATIDDTTAMLALQTVWTRLSLSHNGAALRDTMDYMWQVALGLENTGLSAAEQRLRQAQQALRDALRHGASAEEIEKLMAQLQQAIADYITELAQKHMADPGTQAGNPSPLTFDALEKRLQELEEMARLGNLGAAEHLLSELEKMLNNLQVSPGEGGTGMSAQQRMQGQMDELADLMRRQQDLLDKTNRLEEERRRGEKSDKQVENDMRGLQQEQQVLRQELDGLQRRLNEEGLKPGEKLEQAEQFMQEAERALDEGWGSGARGRQADALQAMRQGAQDLMRQMREQQEKETGRKATGRDPLGRAQGNGQNGADEGDALPGGTDVQRARRILDEIRKRLGNMTPQAEKDYLERLLQFD